MVAVFGRLCKEESVTCVDPEGRKVEHAVRRPIDVDQLPETELALPSAHNVVVVLLVCAGYYFGALIAKSLTFPDSHLSLIWPPTAIMLAGLLLASARMWWMHLVALAPVHIFIQLQGGMQPWAVMGTLIGNFSQALLAAATVLYFNGGQLRFDTFRSIVVFTLCAVCFAPIAASSLAAYLYILSGWETDYWYVWRARILSNALSTLSIVPALIFVAHVIIQAQKIRLRYIGEGAIIVAGLVIVGTAHLWIKTPAAFLLYAPLPWLLWAAVRFGVGGLSSALLITALFIFLGTSSGYGPFAAQSPAENVLSLQLFLITISFPLVFVAGLLEERRANEEALRASQARYRALVMASADMVWRVDASGEITFVGQTWQDLTGQKDSEIRNFGWLTAVHPGDCDRTRRLWEQAIETKRAHENELRVRVCDGTYRHFYFHAVPILAPDEHVLEWVVAITDITERKRAESKLRQQRDELAHLTRISAMGELAASLAHELNQPLTAILSNAQAAQRFLTADTADLKEVREILTDIVDDNNRAGEVIRRMRALVKKEELEYAPFDLEGVIRDVVALVHSDAIIHSTRISVDIGAHLSRVRGSRVQLQQVILNLLLNAFDAMSACPSNARQIVLRVELDLGRVIKVAVRDRGTGLTGDTLEKIFEPFYTTKRDGLGMGLSISRSIIEAHGGRLWAENNPDTGATFYFTLPVRFVAENQ